MRVNPKNTTSKSDWLNGALAGALFMYFLFLIPRLVSWVETHLLAQRPIQAFIEWGTTERVVTYTMFDLFWRIYGIGLVLIIVWMLIAYMMLHRPEVRG